MRTQKVSLTLDEDLLAEARDIVGARGLSSYVNVLSATSCSTTVSPACSRSSNRRRGRSSPR